MIRIFDQYVSAKTVLLSALEAVLIALATLCGARLRFWNDPAEFAGYVGMPGFAVQTLAVVIVFQLCFYYNDLYDLAAVRNRAEQAVRLGQSLGAACLALGLVYFAIPGLLIGRGVFFIGMALVAAAVSAARMALDRVWRSTQRVAVVGSRGLALTLAREIERRTDLNLHLCGFVPAEPAGTPGREDELLGRTVLGSTSELLEIAARERISRIVVAMEDRRGALPVRELVTLRIQGVVVEDAHTVLTALTGRVWLRTVPPSWFIFSQGFRRSRVSLAVKRVVDVALAGAGLLLSAPVMAAAAILVKLDSPGPAIYRQERVGWKGRRFRVLKFRSMRQDAEAGGGAQWAAQEDPRATRVGRVLRKFRLDELPQFINVLRGEMSFVGPRPERPVFVEELRKAIPYYDERHTVRPGLTGWAQVQYPYGSTVEDALHKLEYDLFYLKHMSLLFDGAVVISTVRTVLFGKGAR